MTKTRTKGAKGPGRGAIAPSGTPVPAEPGLAARLGEVVSRLAALVSEFDPDRLTGADATSLYGSLAGDERLVLAGKALLAARIEASGVWQEAGHRDAASLLASVEGGLARPRPDTPLAVGQRLGELPGTAAAVRRGELSGPKVRALTGGRHPRPHPGE